MKPHANLKRCQFRRCSRWARKGSKYCHKHESAVIEMIRRNQDNGYVRTLSQRGTEATGRSAQSTART